MPAAGADVTAGSWTRIIISDRTRRDSETAASRRLPSESGAALRLSASETLGTVTATGGDSESGGFRRPGRRLRRRRAWGLGRRRPPCPRAHGSGPAAVAAVATVTDESAAGRRGGDGQPARA